MLRWSLLLAADWLASGLLLLLLLLWASGFGVEEVLGEIMERYGVLELLEILWISGFVFEGLAKELTLGWVEEITFGEDNFELEVKISKAHWVFVERHAQLFDGFSFFIL